VVKLGNYFVNISANSFSSTASGVFPARPSRAFLALSGLPRLCAGGDVFAAEAN